MSPHSSGAFRRLLGLAPPPGAVEKLRNNPVAVQCMTVCTGVCVVGTQPVNFRLRSMHINGRVTARWHWDEPDGPKSTTGFPAGGGPRTTSLLPDRVRSRFGVRWLWRQPLDELGTSCSAGLTPGAQPHPCCVPQGSLFLKANSRFATSKFPDVYHREFAPGPAEIRASCGSSMSFWPHFFENSLYIPVEQGIRERLTSRVPLGAVLNPVVSPGRHCDANPVRRSAGLEQGT